MIFKKNSLITWGLIMAVLSAGVFLAGTGTSFAKSSAECDIYARNFADRNANPGGDALGSALGGAATGALLGGIVGGGRGAGTGAAIGGGLGLLGGGAASANDWTYLYDRAYHRCMRGDY